MKKAIYLYLFLLASSFAFVTKAATKADSSFTVSYKDSLLANRQNKVLYNNIFINNIGQDTIFIEGNINLPNGWKSLSSDVQKFSFSIPPASIRSVSINLIKATNVPAVWQQVKFKLWQANNKDTQNYSYNIKAEAQSAFRVDRTTEDITLTDRPEVLHLGVHIKNTGNVTDEYTLEWKNSKLGLDESQKIKLEAGKDTTYYYPLKLNNSEWDNLYKETVSLYLKSTNNNAYIDYKLNRPQSNLKQNRSAYNNFPISFEGMAMVYGKNITYSYGGRGLFQFGEHSLALSYRSRQFGATQNIIQKNIFNAEYNYRHWKVQAGQTSLSENFLAIGNGGRIIYRDGNNKEFSIAAVIHDPKMSIFQSDGIAAKAKYEVGKMVVTHTAELNSDKLINTDGVVLNNDVQIIKNKDMLVDVQAGVGLENAKYVPKNGTNIGISLGYNFMYNTGKWSFASLIDYHDKNFPGYRKGLDMQSHTVTYNISPKVYVGAVYGVSSIRRNYFKDTLFNTDVISYNNNKYGILSGYHDSRMNLSLNTGIFKQNGFSNMYNSNQYYYTDANYYLKLNNKGTSQLSITSQNVFNDTRGSLITSDMMSVASKYFGISGVYVRTPVINTEANGVTSIDYNESFNGGPFVNFSFFRNQLKGNIKYQFFRTLKDNYTRTGIESSVTYNTLRTGTYIQLSGYVPLRDDNTVMGLPLNQTRYGILSVSQSLKVPVITHRKFYDLKVMVYYDANSNNKKDKDENSLNAINIGINDEILLTDGDGVVEYDNIKEGNYKLDLINSNTEDLIPVDGSIQSLVINNNTTYEVPFKKGKAINGNIKVVADSFSNSRYSSSLIKITASDTTGRVYTTLTDDNGNFTMYVPEGVYTVSLNEEAYAESDYKPAKVAYTIDLYSHENSFVVFEIRQKKRKVRFLNESNNN